MKDILFTVKQQKKESAFIIFSLTLAICVNIYAIIIHNTEWKELYTQWFTVIVLSMFFYVVIGIFRILYWLLAKILNSLKSLF